MATVQPGAIESIMSGTASQDTGFHPVVQILSCKKIEAAGKADRYRVIASDGERYASCMAASQMNDMMADGSVTEGCLVRLNKYLCNNVQGRSIIILLEVAPEGPAREQIGAPTSYPDGKPPPKAGTAPAPPAPAGGFAPKANAQPPAPKPKPRKSTGPTFPIAELNPYQQRFALKARVTAKGPMRTWDKPTSKGNLFSVDLLDSSGEIRGTFFKELADRMFPILEEGKVYIFQETSARLKPADKRYTALTHDYEMTFGNCTAELVEDDGTIATITGDWKSLATFADGGGPREGTIDVVAVVKAASPPGTIISSKSGKELTKREVTLADDSGYDIRCTFWGELALREDAFWEAQPVLAAKGLRVSDFGGVSLGSGFSSQLSWDSQDEPRSVELRNWWLHGGGREAQSKALTGGGGGGGGGPAVAFGDRADLDDIKARQLGFGEKPDYVGVKATFNFVRSEKMWYEACAQEGCQKKVVQNTDGTYHCEKCATTHENCERRYLLSATFIDSSAQAWLSAFNDTGIQLFQNVTADQLAVYKEEVENEDGKFEDYMKQFLFKQCVLKIRCKAEVWNEQTRVKSSIADLKFVDFKEESAHIIQALKVM